LLEDRLLILRRDAHASVGDGDLGHAAVHRGAHVDPTALGCELEGVGEQVQEDLLRLALVGADRAERLVDRSAEGGAAAGRALAHEVRALSIAVSRSKAVISNSIRPASTFERSRMPLMRKSWCLTAVAILCRSGNRRPPSKSPASSSSSSL